MATRILRPSVTGALLCFLPGLLGLGGCATTTAAGPGGDGDRVASSAPGVPAPKVVVPVGEQAAARFREAVQLYQSGRAAGRPDYAAVEGLLQEALGLDRRFTRAQFNLGVIYEEQGRTKDAEAAYRKTLELDPRYVDALANLGRIAMLRGDRQGALGDFQKVVEIDPFNTYARNNLARVHRLNAVKLMGKGDTEGANRSFAEAVENVRKVLAAEPQDMLAYNNLVLIYYDLEKYELARLVALSALKFNKPDAAIHNNLGLVLLKLNKVTLATAEFQAALQVDPKFGAAHVNLGAISLNYRDFQGAYERFRAALEGQPDDPEILIGLGVAARGLGKLEEAESLYRKVLRLHADYPDAWFNLGILFQEHWNKPQQALESFRSYLRVARLETADDKARADNVRSRVEGLVQLQRIMDQQEQQRRTAPKAAPAEPAPAEPAPAGAASGPAATEAAAATPVEAAAATGP